MTPPNNQSTCACGQPGENDNTRNPRCTRCRQLHQWEQLKERHRNAPTARCVSHGTEHSDEVCRACLRALHAVMRAEYDEYLRISLERGLSRTDDAGIATDLMRLHNSMRATYATHLRIALARGLAQATTQREHA